ncbi:MAG: polysaccharide deacetylase [Anaerolineae bacterium]|jgi:peptidoglycan/xylan/chitin deacetylase (PgdA/CDA1 family)
MTNETPHTVCLTFDFDALSVWLGDGTSATPAMLSRGEFGARVGVRRILKLLADHDIQATFFVPGHTAGSFPEAVSAILTAGHEVAHHSYGHVDPSAQSPSDERRSMERGIRVLERLTGRAPLGYRSPSWDFSETTLSLLVEFGFLYDSSLFADDYHPYHPRLGDTMGVEQPLQSGRELDLWEFPVSFALDDWPYFMFDFESMPCGPSAPSKVYAIWAADFHYMVEHEETGVFTLTLHPQVIGRGHRMALLERFIQHVSQRDVRFARMGDAARELSGGQDGG